jgi:hypothetical protein
MAIETRQQRQAAAGVPFAWAPPVLPSAINTGFQRAASAGGYYFTAQVIQLQPIVANRAFGSITLIQQPATGSRSYSIIIDGVDRSDLVDVNVAPTIRGQINSKFTATFRTVDPSGAYVPSENDPVLIYEGSTLRFRGYIDRTVEERLIKTAVPRVQCSCTDAGVRLSRRVVNAFYEQAMWGSAYFIVPDLIAQHASDLGITYVRSPPPDDIDLTPLGDMLFYGLPFTECMDLMAKRMNADWILGLDNAIRFVTLADATVNSNAFSDASGNWLEVQATRTVALEGNRIFAKSSSQLLQTQTDTFPGNAVGNYVMTYPPRDQSLLPLVSVNGVSKIVVSIGDAAGGAVYDFFRIGTVVQQNLTHTPLTGSDTVEITYPSPVPYIAVAEDLADILANGLTEVILECGNITSKSELLAIANAWLDRLKERATQLTIRTSSNVENVQIPASARSWQPGELVSVNFGATGGAPPVVDDFLVASHDLQIKDNTLTLETLVLSNKQYQRTSNPQKFLQDIIARLRTVALPQTQVLTLTQDTNLAFGFVLNVDQQINLDSTNGPFTVTLPNANEMYGKSISWMKVSADSNPITIAGAVVGGVQQDLNGQPSQAISTQYQTATTEGNQWQ